MVCWIIVVTTICQFEFDVFADNQKPHQVSLHLSTDALANVFVQGEKVQVQACITNRGEKIKVTLNWEIIDARGATLANGSQGLSLKSLEDRKEIINIKSQVGYYAVRAKLLAESKTLASAQIDSSVVSLK